VRQGDWKLILFHHDAPDQKDRFELYNLAEDVGETKNLAAEQPGRVKTLEALIREHLRTTHATVPTPNPKYRLAALLKAPDLTSPKKAYLSYLAAVRDGHLEHAKQCWHVPKDKEKYLDVLAGTWVLQNQFDEAVFKAFGDDAAEITRVDCTDRAVEATRARVERESSVVAQGRSTATLSIDWGDAKADEVFLFSDQPVPFRNVAGQWKIDTVPEPEWHAFDEPGSVAFLMKGKMQIQKALLKRVRRGEFRAIEDLEKAWQEELSKLKKQPAAARKPDNNDTRK
jgi:hypothetical protein